MARRPPTGPDGELLVDAAVLRALASPIRTQLLSALRRQGPATATQLAERMRLDTGTTSYHLRQLAAAGLIVEDSERGNQRDRWWKPAHPRTVFDLASTPGDPELATTFLHNIARLSADEVLRYIDALPTMPRPWQKASSLNDTAVELTPGELTKLLAELGAVVERYRREHRPGARGSHTVAIQYNGFPRLPL